MRDKAEKAPEYTMEPAAAEKRFPPLTVSGGALLLFMGLFFTFSLVLSFLCACKPELQSDYGFNMINIIVSQLVCMLAPVLICMQISGCDFTASMRLRRGINGVQLLLLLPVAAGAFFFANGANSLFVTLLEQIGYKPAGDSFTVSTLPQLIFASLLYGLLPAFCEEVFFRGMVMRSFERFSPKTAVLMSAMLFGIMHGNLQQVFFAFIFGVILAVADLEADSLVPSMLLHFANNFVAMLLTNMPDNAEEAAEYTPAEQLFSMGIWIVLGGALLAAGLFGYIYYTRRRNRRLTGSDKPAELMPGFAGYLDSVRPGDPVTGRGGKAQRAGKRPALGYIALGLFIAAEAGMILLDFTASWLR